MKNNIKLVGTIQSVGETFEHYNIKFQRLIVRVKRQSGLTDDLIVVCPYELFSKLSVETINEIVITGQIRTRNFLDGNKRRLEIYVYAEDIDIALFEENNCLNEVEIEGFICKPINVRTTPKGQTISDVFLAHNNNSKSYYIPTIMFNALAKKSAELSVGMHVLIKGRLQSRIYQKQLESGTVISMTAHELAASSFEIIEE